MCFNQNENNKVIFTIKFLNEKIIKLILILVMSVAIIIPPIPINKIIIEWGKIDFIIYFRAFTFFIGVLFLPGACIFNILLPKCSLPDRLKIEPFLLKISTYPILSIAFIGISTLIIDILGVKREDFSYILFIVIAILFFLDFLYVPKPIQV